MKLTWAHLIRFLWLMWELNQNNIADCLAVSPSTISRLATGGKNRFKYKNDDLYINLFDTTNTKLSHVYGKNKKTLLIGLIDTMEEAGFKDDVANLSAGKLITDFTGDDYEPFVMGMLKLIKDNQDPLPPKVNRPLAIKDNTQPTNTEVGEIPLHEHHPNTSIKIVDFEKPKKQRITFTELLNLLDSDGEIIERTDDNQTNYRHEGKSEIRELFEQAKKEPDIPRAIIRDGTLSEIRDVLRQAINDCGISYIVTDITETLDEYALTSIRDFRELIVDNIVRPVERIGKHVESEAYDLLIALSATLKEYIDLPDDHFNLYGVSSESRIMLQAKIAFLIVKILGIDTSRFG